MTYQRRGRQILVYGGHPGVAGVGPARRFVELRRSLEIRDGAQVALHARLVTLPGIAVGSLRLDVGRSQRPMLAATDDLHPPVHINGYLTSGPVTLHDRARIEVAGHVFVFRTITDDELEALEREAGDPLTSIATCSPGTALLYASLRKLAQAELDLLIVGETGVGKEVVARALHHASRPGTPFIAINCAAVPAALLESELFGFVRGAHSTAIKEKRGLIDLAEGGTLFLDEIGDMDPASQPKLLRFVQDREFIPLGATHFKRARVRVMAATRRSVSDEAGAVLRSDLAARLGPEPMRLPPLRDRAEDIGALASAFLSELGGRGGAFSPEAFQALHCHLWPGNLRELRKTVEFAAVMSSGSVIRIEHLPSSIRDGVVPTPTPVGRRRPRPSEEELREILSKYKGDVVLTSRYLQRQRTLVWRWIREYGLMEDPPPADDPVRPAPATRRPWTSKP
jgi:DNA-binding NtrC family response regulator